MNFGLYGFTDFRFWNKVYLTECELIFMNSVVSLFSVSPILLYIHYLYSFINRCFCSCFVLFCLFVSDEYSGHENNDFFSLGYIFSILIYRPFLAVFSTHVCTWGKYIFSLVLCLFSWEYHTVVYCILLCNLESESALSTIYFSWLR